jgi:hypothetical protein
MLMGLFIIVMFGGIALLALAVAKEEWLLAIGIFVGACTICGFILHTDWQERQLATTQNECEAKGGVLAEWYVRRGKTTETKRACVKKEVVIQLY